MRVTRLSFAALLFVAAAPSARAGIAETAPLSPAQIALFETPHLKNIEHPETLDYRFERMGPAPLVDKVTERIQEIHPDGTKYVTFNFLTGTHHQFFPAVDHFSGNPLLMLFLEHDVNEMRDAIGVAAAYFRDHIRAAFVDQAVVTKTTYMLHGRAIPAQRITLRPFAHDDRFEKLPVVQAKEYSFVLSDRVPGELVELKASMPADPKSGAPAWMEKITYVGETK